MTGRNHAGTWHYISRVLIYTGWIVFTFMFSVLVISWLTSLLVEYEVKFSGVSSTTINVAIGALTYLLMLGVAIGLPWIIWRQRTTLRTLGLSRLPNWKDIALTIGGMATYFGFTIALMSLIAILLPDLNLTEQQDLGGILPSSTVELITVFALLVVIGPVVEELLFRGYMYGKIRKSGAPAWLTILIVSLLFGAVHLQWNVGIDTFALSIVMCLTREISGSVWPSILMHMTKNGLAFYLLFIVGVVG